MRVIDIHTHGIGGYDTRTTRADNILKIAELHGAHGVTDIVPTIYSGPVQQMRANMATVKVAMERQHTAISNRRSGSLDSSLVTRHSKLARIAGVHLEGPFLNPSKAGALDGASFQVPSVKTWRKLLEGFEDIVKIVTIAPELEGSLQLIKTMSNMGVIVALGHSDATYQETERAFHTGATGITHIFNAMRGFHHREPGIAGFGLTNPDIYIELIADPFHLNVQVIELVFRVKNPEKIIIVSDSVEGTTATTENHVKVDDNGTIQGGSTTITESAERLISLGFPKKVVMACISNNPGAYLVPN